MSPMLKISQRVDSLSASAPRDDGCNSAPSQSQQQQQQSHSTASIVAALIEQSIASARASVMIYDETNKKWVPSGSSSGLSKVHIYHHVVNNTYRVVGRKLHDQEVVINCSILKGLKYNQATPTFHQWRDNRQVYGLNFSSKDDAEAFAYSMMIAVDALNNATPGPPRLAMNSNHTPGPPVNNHQPMHNNNNNHHHSEEDMGYRSMTREDIAIISERRMSQPQQQGIIPSLSSPNTPVVNQNQPPPGHHRTNSAPQPPPPPPAMPPQGPTSGAGPPPPPPPMPNGPLSRGGDQEVGSLAAALAQAQLKKANRPQPDAISTTSTSSSSSSGSTSSGSLYGTLRGNRNGMGDAPPGGNAGGSSLMDEMAKTLARRRAMCKENSAPNLPSQNTSNGQDDDDHKPVTAGKMKDSPPSPKTNQRKRTGSDTSSGIIMNGGTNGYESDLESLKQDILKEVRKELYKVKAEIIDAIKIELNRR